MGWMVNSYMWPSTPFLILLTEHRQLGERMGGVWPTPVCCLVPFLN